jgi:LysM repeat protein
MPRRALLLGLIVAAGCASVQPSVAPLPVARQSPVAVPGMVTHQVRPKDTLWAISRQYGVSYHDIMRANRLSDPGQLHVGQPLLIPQRPVVKATVPMYPTTRWTHIVVHHTATQTGNARLFDRAHRRKGWTNGLGYHFLIDNGTMGKADGQIEIGPRWKRQQNGAHCNAGGMNEHGIGICLVGDFTHRRPSDAQLASLAALVEQLRGYYRIPSTRIIRHRDVRGKSTECPGDSFPWVRFKQTLAIRTARQ